ncbi:MAG: hypothetical protein K2X74_07410, partial [Acetobacteraceae bacterium]|nr:hypothetical protein [Acetobacteraceae bacterium]
MQTPAARITHQGSTRAAVLAAAAWLALAGTAGAQPADPRFLSIGAEEPVLIAAPHAPRGLILILPDALGGDPRSLPYAEALQDAGFATLEPQWQEVPRAEQPSRVAALLPALPEVARALGVAPSRIGVLGFGSGARAALQGPEASGLPVAALYPGCASLAAGPAWAPR